MTNDKGFYTDRAYLKGLVPNLRREAEATRGGVTVFHQIRSLLEQLPVDVYIDYVNLNSAFFPLIRSNVERWLEFNWVCL